MKGITKLSWMVEKFRGGEKLLACSVEVRISLEIEETIQSGQERE